MIHIHPNANLDGIARMAARLGLHVGTRGDKAVLLHDSELRAPPAIWNGRPVVSIKDHKRESAARRFLSNLQAYTADTDPKGAA